MNDKYNHYSKINYTWSSISIKVKNYSDQVQFLKIFRIRKKLLRLLEPGYLFLKTLFLLLFMCNYYEYKINILRRLTVERVRWSSKSTILYNLLFCTYPQGMLLIKSKTLKKELAVLGLTDRSSRLLLSVLLYNSAVLPKIVLCCQNWMVLVVHTWGICQRDLKFICEDWQWR